MTKAVDIYNGGDLLGSAVVKLLGTTWSSFLLWYISWSRVSPWALGLSCGYPCGSGGTGV